MSPALPRDFFKIALDYSPGGSESGSVIILPKLLNTGEWFDVQLLSEQDHGDIAVTARFTDQYKPPRRRDLDSPKRRRGWMVLRSSLAVTALILGLLAVLSVPGPPLRVLQDGSLVIGNSPISLLFVGLLIVLIVVWLALSSYRFMKSPVRSEEYEDDEEEEE
jgi:hypothetical protein